MEEFKSPDEIVDILLSELTYEDRATILDIEVAEGMVIFHHSVGKNIRNRFQFWNENNPYTNPYAAPNTNGIIDDPLFPDQVSDDILKKIWEVIHAN